ncbi:cytidylyltransferase domain-containing protein [Metabacillus fastidiosus]|uniref:acylneuraminate cytidylyltransferase family protein n=1 Tax=Metabacillus fastidiosus TaxID=1458 RepID=UPI0008264183|nr:acylneuraminate cytidylyltransferase family protein [Metabacillus fastidiosus]MED4461197.1 acylneuraminate cytidylyltransferase family protein [Metabacillus fastidiosus]
MINGKTILAIIPARGGSKGIPRKNIRELARKPLIAWTIEEAKKSKYIDRLILSSDDLEIIEVAKKYGCDVPFIRPKHLAEDTTPGIAPVIHAINELSGYDYVILLQPTSPFRLAEDIDSCIEKVINAGAPSCVSVSEPEKSPYWMYILQERDRMKQLLSEKELITQRQDLPPVYALNGAIYIAETDWLNKTKTFLTDETVAFIMPRNRSYDIDEEEDLFLCEYIMTNR